MQIAIISLLAIAILLFFLSFFQKDPKKEMEKQMENFSISLMQEILKLKKKVNILEEEMMIPEKNETEISHEKG